MSTGRSGFETRELILISFLAVFLVAARAAMRWHLHIPGHSMLATSFGLVIVRACVPHRYAATLCGGLAGLVVAALGMGKGGPLLVLKLALPGAVVDLGRSLRPGRSRGPSLVEGATLGGLAGLSTLFPMVLVEWLAGVAPSVLAFHLVASGFGKFAFGALGGGAGAWVAKQLAHHGLVPEPRRT